jgi:hypothetical protein
LLKVKLGAAMFLRIIVIVLIILSPAYADDKSKRSIINSIFGNIANELETLSIFSDDSNIEATITGGEKMKPIGSISVVSPLKQTEKTMIFNQTQINNYFVRGDDRQALNLGFGFRQLSNNNQYFLGINSFYDIDIESNNRASIGAEYFSSPFSANANLYKKISGAKTVGEFTEKALSGYDLNLVGQVPYLPWASINYTKYQWDKIDASKSSKGNIFGSTLNLSPTISLELGVDDNNIDNTNNFVTLMFSFPPKNQSTLKDNFFSEVAYEKSDVSKDMLIKVKRSNKIVLESAAVGVVISRLN